MASATYAQYCAAIKALAISGVARTYDQPPRVFNAADLPCKFLWFPSGDNNPLAFGGNTMRDYRDRSVDLVVVYESTAPNADPSFTETVAMMDAIESALLTLDVGQSHLNWRMQLRLYEETPDRWYWAVVTTVNGKG